MTPQDVLYPKLAEHFDRALRSCVDSVFERYDVLAILVSGTILRGTGDPRSDLDVHVLHRGDFRERLQQFHNDVPCEIFVNPPYRIPAYFVEDAKDRRPMTAHMFATGFVCYDPEGAAQSLVEKAKELLDAPPAKLTDDFMARYSVATEFEDAEDLAHRDPEAALLLLGSVVRNLVALRLASQPGWQPRAKDLLVTLRQTDPEAATYAIAAGAGDLKDRLEAARKLCLHVTGADGFFEWTSQREICSRQ